MKNITIEPTKLNKSETKEEQKSPVMTPAIETHLKTFASIIVERIMEDMQNGTLRYKAKPTQ